MIKLKDILNEGRKANKNDAEEVEYHRLAMELYKKIKNIDIRIYKYSPGYGGVYLKCKDMEEPEFDYNWMSLAFPLTMSIPEWHDDGNKAEASMTKKYLDACEKALLEDKGLKKIMAEYNKMKWPNPISKKPSLLVTTPEKTSRLVQDRKEYPTQYRTYDALLYFSIAKVIK